MAVQRFWFKFEWQKWLGDRELHRCSLETRGFWIECIALMEEAETWLLEGTIAELANLIGCSPSVAKRCIDDLEANNAAKILRTKVQKSAKSQDLVKVVSRRLLKRYNLREYNRLAKQKEREKRNVKPVSNPISKDKSLREERIEEKKELREATASPPAPDPQPDSPPSEDRRRSHPAIVALHAVTGIYPPKEIWDELIDRMGFDVDVGKLKTCFTKWRARGYSKTNYEGIIDWYHDGIPAERGKGNGTNRRNNQGNYSAKPTPGAIIADRPYRRGDPTG